MRLALDGLRGLKGRGGLLGGERGGGGGGGGENDDGRGCWTEVPAIAKPDAAIAPARPLGLRFLLEPPDVRFHGIFLLDETADEAMEIASESI